MSNNPKPQTKADGFRLWAERYRSNRAHKVEYASLRCIKCFELLPGDYKHPKYKVRICEDCAELVELGWLTL